MIERLLERLRPQPSRRPELDGLRGFAVLLVMWAHLLLGVGPHNRPFINGVPVLFPGGGLTGVQLFFVLSGYLITTILVREISVRGAAAFGPFYLRRAKRLLPALLVLCAVYGLVVLVHYHGVHRRLGLNSIVAALTYTSNLPLFSTDNYLGHTWSLAVEEQFYLLWPIALFVAYRISGPRFAAIMAVAVIVVTDVARHGVSPSMSWNLFRWDALMIGAFVALVPVRVNRLVGYIGLAVLMYYTVTEVTYQSEVYLATSLASAALLLAAPKLRWLSNPWLQAFGLISYGLYLWHVLILRAGWPGPISLVASIGAALASYVYVELPVMRWALGAPLSVTARGRPA